MGRNEQSKPIVCFIGFGEVARAFVEGWSKSSAASISAYDIKAEVSGSASHQMYANYKADQIRGSATLVDAIAESQVVFSTVNADQTIAAATAVIEAGVKDRLFLDFNSSAPQTKVAARDVIEGAGGRYVDVAIMASVYPLLHETPLLVCGPWADEALVVMTDLGMSASIVDGPVGTASGINLTRSIVVKGMEALCGEMLVAATELGVTGDVIASLDQTHPGIDWDSCGAFALDRMMIHGERCSAEMVEAAKMVDSLGLPSGMSQATANWQKQVGAMKLDTGMPDAVKRALRLIGAFQKGKRENYD